MMNLLQELAAEWGGVRDIALYGFGRQGKGYIAQLESLYNVTAIIDNGKAGGSWHGIPIVNYGDFLRCRSGTGAQEKIVISSSGRSHAEITGMLVDSDMRELHDFMDADLFLVVSNWYQKGKVVLGRVAIPVTERCTLCCEKCMVSVPRIASPEHYPFGRLRDDADLLFSRADYIGVVQVFGGEPYLNRDLAPYIAYLEQQYKDRIGIIQIISNATVLPSPELLEQFQANGNLDIRFSDYTGQVPYRKRFDEVLDLLRSKNIAFGIEKFDWLDMGHPLEGIQMGRSPEEVASHMFSCSGRCQTFCGGRYYFCSRAWGAEKAYGITMEPSGDYLELAAVGREELVRFHVGFMAKGYSPFCNRCRGFDCGRPIVPGVQGGERNGNAAAAGQEED